jgi:hypothetical protein
MPVLIGSTTFNTAAVVTVASKALPPLRSIWEACLRCEWLLAATAPFLALTAPDDC